MTPDYLYLLKEASTPKSNDYLKALFAAPTPDPILPHPHFNEAKELLKGDTPLEEVLEAIDRAGIEDKDTLIKQLHDHQGSAT